MNRLARRGKQRLGNKRGHRGMRGCESNETLEALLALDRMVIEVSLRAYGVPRGQRSLMRRQNRRLHRQVRAQWPRLLEIARKPMRRIVKDRT
jgi:hypothetical protein